MQTRLPSDVRSSDAAFAVGRADGTFVHVSDGFCGLVGTPRAELVSRRPGAAVPGLRWMLERLPEPGKAVSYERTFETAGACRLVEVTVHRVDDDLLVCGLVEVSGSSPDGVADHRLLGSIPDAAPSAAVVYDRDHRIVRVNRAVEDLGRVRPVPLGRRVVRAMPDVDPGVLDAIATVLDAGVQIVNQHVERDGRTFLLSFFPVQDTRDEIVQVGCLFSDVSELAAAEGTIRTQHGVIRELATPLLEVADGVLVAPLVDEMDTGRIRALTERLLVAITKQRAQVVILDVAAVPAIDSSVAHELMGTAAVARLMGAQVVMSGLSSDRAEAVARLGVDVRSLRTVATLAEAVALARSAARVAGPA